MRNSHTGTRDTAGLGFLCIIFIALSSTANCLCLYLPCSILITGTVGSTTGIPTGGPTLPLSPNAIGYGYLDEIYTK